MLVNLILGIQKRYRNTSFLYIFLHSVYKYLQYLFFIDKISVPFWSFYGFWKRSFSMGKKVENLHRRLGMYDSYHGAYCVAKLAVVNRYILFHNLIASLKSCSFLNTLLLCAIFTAAYTSLQTSFSELCFSYPRFWGEHKIYAPIQSAAAPDIYCNFLCIINE